MPVDHLAHGPTDQTAAEQIHHQGHVQPPLLRADIGEVGAPDAVGRLGFEMQSNDTVKDCIVTIDAEGT